MVRLANGQREKYIYIYIYIYREREREYLKRYIDHKKGMQELGEIINMEIVGI